MSGHADAAQVRTAEQMLQRIQAADLDLPVEEHGEALTVEAWEPFHAQFTKVPGSLLTRCLFMKDKKKQVFLLVTLASTKTDLKAFAKAAGAKEPRFAPEDLLDEKLAVVKGAVNPFAIVNDAAGDVKLFVEEALLQSDKPLCFHPSDNTKTVILSAAQLKQFFEKNSREVNSVDLTVDPSAAAASAAPKKPAAKKAAAKKPAAKKAAPASGNQEGMQHKKEDDFAKWYQDVIQKADLIEYYDISGCFILRPGAMGIWKQISGWLDNEITKMGVEPCYFPMFVTKGALEREEGHLEGFSAEVAWVTKSGGSDLDEPIAVRPTSETVMYPSYKKWIRSHRDLPLRLNQWCNVVRWEFSHATPFIRTREFLWQEGHTAHETQAEADKEVNDVLALYAGVYEDLMAVPVVRGTKTEKEKFAGGDYTMTVEAFVPTVGRSVQGATSHCLGTNFGKMFDIKYENQNHEMVHPIQNSWGLTTRTIGVMIMVHGDDKGLVLPPRVAPTQVVAIGVGINKKKAQEEVDKIVEMCDTLTKKLVDAGVRAKADMRDTVTSGNKCNHWELRGVPMRLEVGTAELERGVVSAVFRFDGSKKDIPLDNFEANIKAELNRVHDAMLANARKVRDDHQALLNGNQWSDFVVELNKKKSCLVPFCGAETCEDKVKKASAEETRELLEDAEEVDERAPSMGAKSLCIPTEQPSQPLGDRCFRPECTNKPVKWTLFGRSY
eukprot:TRINITY_DN372_c0_g1_i13.p1 TRINITY_DN372_c0_g1~~TRINITY_DN372_c0_g1_i13.p1  ORF type:complete len:722 (+),score=362.78 TRINITY_DN372_c0_g1_i13:104-2269(+)